MLTTITFKHFRGFSDLLLNPLSRVNLVVGRNNAGKTSLLEGIALAADPSRIPHMPGLLRAASGLSTQRYFRWLIKDGVDSASLEGSGPDIRCSLLLKRAPESEPRRPEGYKQVYENDVIRAYAPTDKAALRVGAISVQHRDPDALVRLFARAVKQRGGEERIEGLLRAVDQRVKKIRVEPSDDANQILVDLGMSEMLPLSQVGQGMYRLVAIFSELIGERSQICIIDEVENGIHHSLLEQVWTGLAIVAEELKIQIFATTHSHECIQAAHAAFAQRDSYDLSIIQLFRLAEGIQGRVLDRKHIEAALAGEIDPR